MGDSTTLGTEQKWMYWEGRATKARLSSGHVVELLPGDQLLIEYSNVTGEVATIIGHMQRTLH